jgi:membrane protease YdiL (CAAX protease family)
MRKLGAASAIGAYIALFIGFVSISAAAQPIGIVPSLWITEALAIALPAVVVLLATRVKLPPYLGLRRVSWKHVIVAVVATAANQPVVSFVTWVTRICLPLWVVAKFDAQQRFLARVFEMHGAAFVATVTIAAPLGEELFFRGFAFPALTRSWGVVAGILVSGAAFSAIHLDAVGFPGLMGIGVLLAALRWWSGSLWPAIIGHAVNNGIAGTAFLLGMEDPDSPPPRLILITGAVLLIAGIGVLVRVLRRPSAAPAVEEPAPAAPAAVTVLSIIWVSATLWGMRDLVELARQLAR